MVRVEIVVQIVLLDQHNGVQVVFRYPGAHQAEHLLQNPRQLVDVDVRQAEWKVGGDRFDHERENVHVHIGQTSAVAVPENCVKESQLV